MQQPMQMNRNMNGNNRQFNGNRRQNNNQNSQNNSNNQNNQGFRVGTNAQGGGGPQLRRKRVAGAVTKVGNQRNAGKPANGQPGALKKRGRVLKNGRRVQDRYQINKPWVTDEIRAAHEKKVELANQLKGNKNDELFAEFKVKRDEFVKLYDAARQEFNKNKVIVNSLNNTDLT